MANQIDKLKNSINKEYTKLFELNLMKSSGFIPVDKKNNDLYVVINSDKLNDKQNIITVVQEKFLDLKPQLLPISTTDFDALIEYISQINNAQIAAKPVSTTETKTEPSAEEMLIGVGWLTREQLDECIAEASNKKLPLDAIFHEKDYLNYERIVSYLKKKYGVEIISKSNITTDSSILKMLPDDFIYKKKTIIMSMEGNKLAVAMVNPTDKYIIREISLSTGRSLNVYGIPYFEYENYLKEYEAIKKQEQNNK